jgi:four helix bundle protein
MQSEAAQDFRDLLIWQRAHQLVLSIYNYSDYFPQKEVYGLTPQFRRAAASIPISIIESLREENKDEKGRLMSAARTSLEECRYYLILAKDLGYGDNPELMPLLEEVSKMLSEEARLLRDA